MELSACHYSRQSRSVMNPVVVLRVALALVVLALPGSLQSSCPSNADTTALESCRSRSCLVCQNAPATCSVDPTNRIVSCKGDTSGCSSVVECDPCSRCLAYYGGNGTTFRFSSACISMDYPFGCRSVPAKCERSDEVVVGVGYGEEEGLFRSNQLWCSCHGVNCTAQLEFRYNVSKGLGATAGHMLTAWKRPSVSPSSAPRVQHVSLQQMELQTYELAIAMLSCVLLICLAFALVLVGLGTRKLILQRRTALMNSSFQFQKLKPSE